MSSYQRKLAVVIMAAGKGTRMNNPGKAKVMYEINGKPLIVHVVDLALQLNPDHTIVIVGWQKDSVVEYLSAAGKPVLCVEQIPQLGTGHAVMQAEHTLHDFRGDVLVLSGDVPLLRRDTLTALAEHHQSMGAVATVLTADAPDPTGYGRILRREDSYVTGIVEQKDATEQQRAITEINSGIYLFASEELFRALSTIRPDNTQKEYYLTDVFSYFWTAGRKVAVLKAKDVREIMGINTAQQLEEAKELMSLRMSRY